MATYDSRIESSETAPCEVVDLCPCWVQYQSCWLQERVPASGIKRSGLHSRSELYSIIDGSRTRDCTGKYTASARTRQRSAEQSSSTLTAGIG